MAVAFVAGEAAVAQTDATDSRAAVTDSVRAVSGGEAPATRQPSQAGFFAQGRKRVGGFAGFGRTFNQNYLILGVGAGYYVVDGLEVGGAVEGWLLQSPTIWKITPEARYTVWQIKNLHPVVGAFWRRTFVTDYPDYSSWGGRAGLLYRRGRGFAGLALIYERLSDCDSELFDCDVWYPEFAFSLYF
jgi:hypothetical protein